MVFKGIPRTRYTYEKPPSPSCFFITNVLSFTCTILEDDVNNKENHAPIVEQKVYALCCEYNKFVKVHHLLWA